MLERSDRVDWSGGEEGGGAETTFKLFCRNPLCFSVHIYISRATFGKYH